MELRAFFEMAYCAQLQPLLARRKRGRGEPVVLIPAFMLGDGGTAFMRKHLRKMGYRAYGWRQGRNTGLRMSYLDGLLAHIEALTERFDQPVTVVGWSLGGVYARAVAAQRPDLVRQVITLGSPFNAPTMDDDAISGPVLKLYEWLNPDGLDDPMLDLKDCWQSAPTVPSTAIYSEGDGIAHWHYCVDKVDENTENIRVPGSHLGMTHNAAVLYAVADRLAQRRDWQPFKRNLWSRKVYSRPQPEEVAEALDKLLAA